MLPNTKPLGADMQGPLSGNGLHRLLMAAAERHMFASIIITGGAVDGVIYMVAGRIALRDCHDIKSMRLAQHDLTNLLRENASSPTGTFYCSPLIDFEDAAEVRMVTVHQVLAAVGAIAAGSPAPTEAQSLQGLVAETRAATATPEANTAETIAPVAQLNIVEPPGPRRVRASQLRKMLRQRATIPSAEVDPSIAAIADVDEAPASRENALRSIIAELAS